MNLLIRKKMKNPNTTAPAIMPPIRGQLVGSTDGGGGKGGVGDGSVDGFSA